MSFGPEHVHFAWIFLCNSEARVLVGVISCTISILAYCRLLILSEKMSNRVVELLRAGFERNGVVDSAFHSPMQGYALLSLTVLVSLYLGTLRQIVHIPGICRYASDLH